MKLMKKLFSSALALGLAVAMAGSVMADPTMTTSTINKDTKGSITVTKYQTNTEYTAGTATGTTADASTPTDADLAKLSGVTFKLYRVMSTDDVIKYYNGLGDDDSVAAKTIDNYAALKNGSTDNTWEMKSDLDYVTDGNSKLKDKNNATAADKAWTDGYIEGVTDTNGQIVFSELPVGMYVLIETGTDGTVNKDSVTKKSSACLISVPMVNTERETNTTTDNSKWLYDINVYPKNETKGAAVKIAKLDASGAELKDDSFEFTLQKYTDNWAATDGAPTPKNIDKTTGTVVFDNLKYGYYTIQETAAKTGYIIDDTKIKFIVNKDNTITCKDTVTNSDDNTYTGLSKFDLQVTDTTNFTGTETALTSDTTTHDTLLLKIKNEIPDLTKKVANNGGQTTENTEDWVDDTQYNMNEVYQYQITVNVPANVADMTKFTITDTPDEGIDDDTTTNFTVKVGDTALEAADYTVTPVDANADNKTGKGFTLVFTAANLSKVAGKTVTITYNAKLNEKAVVATENGTAQGNENTASLEYSHHAHADADNTDNYKINDDAVVYTYAFAITKYKDSVADANKASGIEFELYTSDAADAQAVKLIAKTGYYIPAGTITTGTVTTMSTGSDGTITVKGLEKGTYYLKETKTLDGYNLLSTLFTVEIKVTEATTYSPDSNASFSGATLTKNDYASTAFTNGSTTDKADTTADIINKKGFVLPVTGSFGTFIYYIGGLFIIAVGAIFLIASRKRKVER